MEIDVVNELLVSNLKIRRSRVLRITPEGEIWVENYPEGLPIPCDFLKTSSSPPPHLNPEDLVLYAMDEIESRGYVLGVIKKYQANEDMANNQLTHPNIEQDLREIKFNAKERIELRCGKSSLTLNKDGKVVIKGVQVTSRAREVNKVKGAAVQIN